MKNNVVLLLLLCFPITSSALFCPTNFNQIDIGDSIDKVRASCGKPNAESTKEVEKSVPQQWDYFREQNVNLNMGMASKGALKVSMVFDANDKIISLSVNGIGVGATAICGSNLSLGDSREEVKSACGEPVFTTKSNTTDVSKPDKVTEFIYTSTPATTLIFTNGKLVERK